MAHARLCSRIQDKKKNKEHELTNEMKLKKNTSLVTLRKKEEQYNKSEAKSSDLIEWS